MGISGRLLRWHMAHIAIVEELNGKPVDWMEKVSDEQYQAGSNGEIDAAYRTKYRRHGATYVNMMVSPEARSTTIKLTPRSASS